MKTKLEEYKVLAINSGHITRSDAALLSSMTHSHPHTLIHPFKNMIMERDAGYFIKLYDEEVDDSQFVGFSESLIKILKYAHQEGFRMIEIDCDAKQYPELFETFDW